MIFNSSCQVSFLQFFAHSSVDLAETQAVFYGGYVSTELNKCTECVHGRVSFFHASTAVSTFLVYTAVLVFFPVRPCHGFSRYGPVTFFHVRPCILSHVRPCHKCVHTHSRPVFIIINISYYQNAIEKHYKK